MSENQPSASAPTAAASEVAPGGAPRTGEEPLPLQCTALLLDMDGTLVDSGASVERSWNRFLEEQGSTRRFEPSLHGRPARQLIAELLPGLDEEQAREAHRRVEHLEIEDASGTVTLPGTARLLAELGRAQEQLGRQTWAIVTSCTRALFEARWGFTELPFPETLVTADDVAHGKPDPEPYRAGAERLGADASGCVVLEDSLGGLESGRAAGCRTVAVTTTTPAAELRDHADVLVTSLDDLRVRVEGDQLVLERR